jgi:uncharacterized protein
MKTVVVFTGLAYALSWLFWLPLYGPRLGVNNLPVLPYHHAIGALGPMVAAFVVTYQKSGRRGVSMLLRRMADARNKTFLLLAALSPFVLLLLASGIDYLVNGATLQLSLIGKTKEFPEFGFFSYLFYNLVFFGFGEEVGWAGVAVPHLQKRTGALGAAIVFTLFWAIWHWPLFLYRPGYTSMSAAGIAGWFFSLLTGRVLLSWMLNSSRGSILVCALFHATIDVAFVSDFASGERINYLGMLITVWGIVTVIVFGAKHLSRQKRYVSED